MACLSNLHQIGLGLELYIQDNNHRLPFCAQLPTLNSNLTPITTALAPYLQAPRVYLCPADTTYFKVEKTSYEWNNFLNGASYDHPEEWSPATQTIVDTIFGGRLNTPLVGDAAAYHPKEGTRTGKNALYFEGRVQSAKTR